MVKVIYVYLLTMAVFFAIDLVWLGVVAKNFYQKHLAHLMSSEVNWTAAMLFYSLYIAGILLFAVAPALKSGSAMQAVGLGACLGLLAYATYDLTNLATLKDWPLLVTVIDLIWGMLLTSAVAAAGYHIARWIGWQPA